MKIVDLQKRIEYLEGMNAGLRSSVSEKEAKIKELDEALRDVSKDLAEQVKWLRALVSSTFAREVTITKPDGTLVEKTWNSPIEETTYKTYPMRGGFPRY